MVLDCNDTECPHRPVVLRNGMYGTQWGWAPVQRLLDDKYQVITFDERARGKSGRSADYSFAGCLDDLAADRIRCPVTFVNAEKRHAGATDERLTKMRAGIDRNPLVTVFATLSATHTRILAKHPDAIVVAAGS